MGLAASRQESFWEFCSYGRIHKVREFILEGIDVNWVSNIHDCCPIHVASQGKPEVVELLLAADCNVNARDIRGNLALHHAAMKGHAAIVERLIQAGSEKNAQDKNGWTALHCAAYWCHKDVVRVLLKHACNVHVQNKDERTPLHETARSPERDEVTLGEISDLLIGASSDINAKSSDLGEADFTPLMFAAYHDHPDVALTLITAGCDIDSYGTNGWTALHWAADRSNEEVVCLLLESGANPTKRGLRGELPSDRAKVDEIRMILLNALNLFNELASLDDDPLIQPSPQRRSLRLSASFKRGVYSPMTPTDHAPAAYKRRSQFTPNSPGEAKLGNFLNGFTLADPESADRLLQVTSLVEQVSIAQHPYDTENVIQGGGAGLVVQGSDDESPVVDESSSSLSLMSPSGESSREMSDVDGRSVAAAIGSRRESCSTDEDAGSDAESLSALSESEGPHEGVIVSGESRASVSGGASRGCEAAPHKPRNINRGESEPFNHADLLEIEHKQVNGDSKFYMGVRLDMGDRLDNGDQMDNGNHLDNGNQLDNGCVAVETDYNDIKSRGRVNKGITMNVNDVEM